jgi:hypothetical protein
VGDDNIIYKYLDSNLFAVTTYSPLSKTVSVFLINGATGKVVHSFKEEGVSEAHSVKTLISENYFILTFRRPSRMSLGIPQQYLSVTEFYSSQEETDTIKLLKDFYINQADRLTQQHFNSFDLEYPLVLQQSYLLTLDVKAIALTQSQSHVTSKTLVMITSNDQVYSLENALFTARR